MAALVPVTKFSRDKPTKDAHAFMLGLEANFDDTLSDKRKAIILEALLTTNLLAATWFKGVPNATEATWDDLKKAFKLKWPKKPAQGISVTEAVNTLKNQRLASTCLGTYETMHNQDVPAHTIWGRAIVADAKKWNMPGIIANDIRAALPEALKGMLSTVITEWDNLLTELEKVLVPALKEKVQEKNLHEQRMADIERRLGKSRISESQSESYATIPYTQRFTPSPRPMPNLVMEDPPATAALLGGIQLQWWHEHRPGPYHHHT
ncbi:hypothetical protein EW026_g8171 [Hermanssonia centrifuga]|uniref:Gag protein n=1 Tax=Hermanssonia centrifuga TaxID=98765 RepID=A0A4S4K692_9APHY|nr:hypothetical protein EW026_g8171 [Hermanssonia centrifuga]